MMTSTIVEAESAGDWINTLAYYNLTFTLVQRSLTSAEDECSHLKEICESGQEELRQLAKRYQDQLKEVQELQEKLQVWNAGTFAWKQHWVCSRSCLWGLNYKHAFMYLYMCVFFFLSSHIVRLPWAVLAYSILTTCKKLISGMWL